MYEPLAELWSRIRGKRPEPIVQQEEESIQAPPELTEEQILEQLLHKLRKPREVVLITISSETKASLSVEDAFLRNWHYPSMFKQAYESTMFQHLVATPWRWNTQGGGMLKRSRLKLSNEWGAWIVAGIPHGDDLAPTEIYLRLDIPDRPDRVLVHPVIRQSTKLHNALVSNACLLLGCRIVESRYFKNGYLYRLESNVTHDFYRTFLAVDTDVY